MEQLWTLLLLGRVWGRHAPTRSLRKCRRIAEVKSRMDRKFSRIENLWPRDGSCPLPLRSKPFLGNCFRIVKTQKISSGALLMWWDRRLTRTKFLPLFMQRRCPARSRKVWGHGTVSRSDGLWRIQGTVWRKLGAVRTLRSASFKHKNNALRLCCQQPKENFGELYNHIRFYLWKRKIPPTQRSDDFVGWIGGKMNRMCCGAVSSFVDFSSRKWWVSRW